MKKIINLLIVLCLTSFLTACSSSTSDMEDISIYTTTYPINYLITTLYEEHAKIYSIYPTGVDIDTYELSDRKLEEYANSDLFIFNSLDKDRDYAVEMINLNSNLKVIDVATNIEYDYSIEELWLDPSNYLMMAENVQDGLAEYISNPYLISEIEEKFEDLKYEISKLDANLTETIKEASYNTIVVDDDLFLYLTKYGLNVISLEENSNLTTNKIEEVKSLISSNKVKYIYSSSSTSNDTVQNLIDTTNVELITLNTMHSIDGSITNSNEDYFTIMTENINCLKQELYK